MSDNPWGKPTRCHACPLFKEPGIVPGEGPDDAAIMIVGEAPGEEEAQRLKPFIGGSGRILSRMLWQAGVERTSCFVTNVVKCRPPGNRTPTDEEMRVCAPFIVEELKRVKPNVIVALGNTALYALTERNGIFKNRGVPLEGALGTKVIGTIHPAAIMRQQQNYPLVLFDLGRAAREQFTPSIVRFQEDYNVDASPGADFPALLADVRERGRITFDLETTNLDPRTSQIICIGLGTRRGQAHSYRWTPEVAKRVSDIWCDPTIWKVGQNSEGFDIPFTEHKLKEMKLPHILQGRSYDTMLMWHLLNSDLPKDLGTIGATYCDMPYWKDEGRGAASRDMGQLMRYNCKDIHGTTDGYDGMLKDLEAYDMLELHERTAAVQHVNRAMKRRGIKKDWAKSQLWALAMTKKANAMEANLKAGLGRSDFDLNSPKQLMKLLYQDMGLPTQYTRATKDKEARPTSNAEAIEELARSVNNPILNLIVDIRTLRKFVSTYCLVEGDEQGMVHATFSNAKAANGRFNSYEPNMQNVPLELRELYVPDSPDHVFISADWNQVEWRLNIVGAGDDKGLEILASGRDNHKAVASEVLDLKYELITDEQRHGAKFILYGLSYGRGAKSIAKENNREVRWVENFINRFAKTFDDIWKERERWVKLVEKQNYVTNPFNRRRWWFSQMVTEIYNFWPSSTAADMMIDVLTAMYADVPDGVELVLTVHDEVVAHCHKDRARVAYAWMKDHMNRTWPQITEASRNERLVRQYYPQGWFCPAEPEFGNNWRECKKGNAALKKELLG